MVDCCCFVSTLSGAILDDFPGDVQLLFSVDPGMTVYWLNELKDFALKKVAPCISLNQ